MKKGFSIPKSLIIIFVLAGLGSGGYLVYKGYISPKLIQSEKNVDSKESIIPEVTIHLIPKSNPLSVSANVMLVDAVQDASYLETHPSNVIASYPVEIIIEKKMVIKDDVETAKSKLVKELKDSAEVQLANQLQKMNQEEGTDLTLLRGENSIKFGDPSIYVDQPEVSGSIQAKGIAFNYDEIINILEAKLKLSKSPEKNLISIDAKSVDYRVYPIETDADPTRQMVTATIKGVEQYEIDPKKENGRRLIENIRTNILGKSVQEAENYIKQLPAIDKVIITSIPTTSTTIPDVPENINIEIVEDEEIDEEL